jgi:MurNAc alpha-1-phosphate uridylyltransferase
MMPQAVMVFAAGLGTRMRPRTLHQPKPLVEVAGKSLIDHNLDLFAAAGVARAVVNVHWLGDQIIAHLAGRQRPEIIISDERTELLDQGGGIKKALPLLGAEPFFICNTDAFWCESPGAAPCVLKRLGAAFDPALMDALLLVAHRDHAVGVDGPGDFTLDPHGRLARFPTGRNPSGRKEFAQNNNVGACSTRKSHSTFSQHALARRTADTAPWVYTGVGIIQTSLCASDPRAAFSLAPLLFEAAARGRLYGQPLDHLWLHVGSEAAVTEAEQALAMRMARR